jgi:hypothetical protein
MSSMLNQVNEEDVRSNKKKDKEQATTPDAEVIDWFLAIDLMHV